MTASLPKAREEALVRTALAAPSTTTTSNPLLAPLVLDSPDLLAGLGNKTHWRVV